LNKRLFDFRVIFSLFSILFAKHKYKINEFKQEHRDDLQWLEYYDTTQKTLLFYISSGII
jgi:hypothetical protein